MFNTMTLGNTNESGDAIRADCGALPEWHPQGNALYQEENVFNIAYKYLTKTSLFDNHYLTTGILIDKVPKDWECFIKMMASNDTLVFNSVEVLKDIDSVSEIYFQIDDGDVNFFILLDNEEYDSSLMRLLFKRERLIKPMWDGKDIEFHYAPLEHIDKPTLLVDYHIAYKKG